MVKLWIVCCILAMSAVVVNSAHHHIKVPSPAPATDCSTIIYDMVDCISFLSDGSKETKPDASCCSGFKSVLKTDPHCICEAIKDSDEMGIELNITKAMTLPSACRVSAPPLSNCGIPVAPGATPAHPPKSPRKSAPSPSSKAPAPVTSPAKTPVPAPGKSIINGGGAITKVPAPSPLSLWSLFYIYFCCIS
ncbi:hypothetical protein L1049_025898 [Liquidambar formosana]|uniref:Bifunctional inhibitor/plant lipid transfer protein/seed storage helical domain-containing protein n=1 Tax=Liquidambar formosana TaxID=63359 RepID=A0AAP0NEH8_LIQFO